MLIRYRSVIDIISISIWYWYLYHIDIISISYRYRIDIDHTKTHKDSLGWPQIPYVRNGPNRGTLGIPMLLQSLGWKNDTGSKSHGANLLIFFLVIASDSSIWNLSKKQTKHICLKMYKSWCKSSSFFFSDSFGQFYMKFKQQTKKNR